MPKLTIEVDFENGANTRILLDGEPVGVVQHIDFAQHANRDPGGRIFIYDLGTQDELLKKLEACPWFMVVRLDPATQQPLDRDGPYGSGPITPRISTGTAATVPGHKQARKKKEK